MYLYREEVRYMMHAIRYLFQKQVPMVQILKFGTPQTIAIIVVKIENFDVTLH